MRHVLMLAIVTGAVGVTPGLAEPPKELSGAAKRELKSLEGKWSVVKFLHPDRETTPGQGDDAVVIEFKGNAIDFAGSAAGSVVELDPTTEPTCLDFKALEESGVFRKGVTYESIYKLDGDTLTWAVYTGRGKSRPTALDKPTETGVMVMVLNRIKK